MIKREDIIADLHMHTIASLHAYSTIKEMVDAAYNMNLKYIAITDHFIGYKDDVLAKNETARIEYLADRMRYEKVNVISGVELNLHQNVPFIDKFKNKNVWMPIGLHSWFVDFDNMVLEDVYNYFKEAVDKNNCTSFAHIERDWDKINSEYLYLIPEVKNMLEKIVELAVKNNKPLELNESSFFMADGTNYKKIEYWLNIAKEMNAVIYLGTDSHMYSEVGHFENCLKMLNGIRYPEDLIINIDENKLKCLMRK